jgi:hypothetical protein
VERRKRKEVGGRVEGRVEVGGRGNIRGEGRGGRGGRVRGGRGVVERWRGTGKGEGERRKR